MTLTGCPAFGCPDGYRHLSLDDKIVTCLQTGRRVPVYSTHALAEIASVDDDAINGRRIGPELVESSGLDLADFQLASDLALKW